MDEEVNKEYIYYESSKGNFRVGLSYGYEFNDENILSMKSILSQDQDTDVVEKFIELKSAEMIYQASIQVGAKLIQPTILDYIR